MRTLILTFLLILAACGGGDPEPGDMAFIGPVDCINHPESCK